MLRSLWLLQAYNRGLNPPLCLQFPIAEDVALIRSTSGLLPKKRWSLNLCKTTCPFCPPLHIHSSKEGRKKLSALIKCYRENSTHCFSSTRNSRKRNRFMPGTLKSRIKADGDSGAPALFQALTTQGRETILCWRSGSYIRHWWNQCCKDHKHKATDAILHFSSINGALLTDFLLNSMYEMDVVLRHQRNSYSFPTWMMKTQWYMNLDKQREMKPNSRQIPSIPRSWPSTLWWQGAQRGLYLPWKIS